jgi:hypothetical protein
MDALESIQTIPGQQNAEDNATAPGDLEEHEKLQENAEILDAIALLHTYHKPNSVKTFRDLYVSANVLVKNSAITLRFVWFSTLLKELIGKRDEIDSAKRIRSNPIQNQTRNKY